MGSHQNSSRYGMAKDERLTQSSSSSRTGTYEVVSVSQVFYQSDCSLWITIAVMRIHRLFSMVLSLSLLLSAVGPLLQTDCPLGDRSSHAPVDHHSAGMHSHTSSHKQDLPCAPDRDTTPAGPVPCAQHAAPCCAFQAVPAAKMVTVLFESSRISLDEIILPRLPNILFEMDPRASLFRPISSPRCSACPFLSDRQAFLGTFLI